MFCSKCGNEIQEGARFCGKCGAPLSSGGKEPLKERAEGSEAGDKTTGAETLAQAKETGKKLGAGLNKWLTDYMDTWRGFKQLEDSKKRLWLGIHGGVALLLVCILIARFALSGGDTHDTTEGVFVAGGGNAHDTEEKAKPNEEELLEKDTEDGKITPAKPNEEGELLEKDTEDGEITPAKPNEEEKLLGKDTEDGEITQEELFGNMSDGTWKFNQKFFDMMVANLGNLDKANYDAAKGKEPLYISIQYRGLIVRGEGGLLLESIKGFTYEQGEGKTVTFMSKDSSMTASYDKEGDNLIIIVDGTKYVLSPTTIKRN